MQKATFSPGHEFETLKHQHNAALLMQRATISIDAKCNISISVKAPLSRPPAIENDRFGCGGCVGLWVGREAVHDSAHVAYRLLAPGTEPSRGPQPIMLMFTKTTMMTMEHDDGDADDADGW